MPDTIDSHLLPAAARLVNKKARRMRIAVTALLIYLAVSLCVQVRFYNELSDTCIQRSHARAALVTALTQLNDTSSERSSTLNDYILVNLPPLTNC